MEIECLKTNSSINIVNETFLPSIKIYIDQFKCPLNGSFKCNKLKHLNGLIIGKSAVHKRYLFPRENGYQGIY